LVKLGSNRVVAMSGAVTVEQDDRELIRDRNLSTNERKLERVYCMAEENASYWGQAKYI
jgi:hypothetical protein